MQNQEEYKGFFLENSKDFPAVIDGQINIVKFLEATTALISLLERLGKAFAPVRYDMQGNIDKIRNKYTYNNKSCLLTLMIEEVNKGKPEAAEGVLWLNRALLFFELLFQQIIYHIQSHKMDTSMNKMFTKAYEGSVKQYHNWVTQQVFSLICKMSPTLPQILKSLEVNNNLKEFELKLTNFNITLHLVRVKIDNFFKDNNIFDCK